jgi:hypothetical protein
MALAGETKGLALGPLPFTVLAERLQSVTTTVRDLLPPELSKTPFTPCCVVSAFMLPNNVLGVRGTTYA